MLCFGKAGFLQKILASGVAETTPFRASVADLNDRQRDLMLDALREQNRSLRSQIMRLQACLQGLPGSKGTVMSGPEGSPRIANNAQNQGLPPYNSGSPDRVSSPNGSPKQQRFKLLDMICAPFVPIQDPRHISRLFV